MKMSPLAAIFSIAPSAFAGAGEADTRPAPCSMRELMEEVERWGRQYIPAFSASDVEAITGWLNQNFYKLSQ